MAPVLTSLWAPAITGPAAIPPGMVFSSSGQSQSQGQSWSKLWVVTPRRHSGTWNPSILKNVLSSVVSKLVRHKLFSRPRLLVQPEFPKIKQNVAGTRGLSAFQGSGQVPTHPFSPAARVRGHACPLLYL